MSTSPRIACVVVLLIVQGLVGCAPSQPSPITGPGLQSGPGPTPTTPAPGPTPSAVVSLVPFADPRTGQTTTDVYDASNHRFSFNTAGQLVWGFGAPFPGFGYPVDNNILVPDPRYGFEFLEVRFGTANGENRAYLLSMRDGGEPTGTMVDLGDRDSGLEIRATNIPPPGTYTLEGFVYGETGSGLVPVVGADVWLFATHIEQVARGTDANGHYRLPGLYYGPAKVHVFRGSPAYPTREQTLTIQGDTRFDIILRR